MSEPKPTIRQLRALRQLNSLHEKHPNQPHGFNPPRTAARGPATYWRRMEPMGLVAIDRVSERHFRYSITEKGRAALDVGEQAHG